MSKVIAKPILKMASRSSRMSSLGELPSICSLSKVKGAIAIQNVSALCKDLAQKLTTGEKNR